VNDILIHLIIFTEKLDDTLIRL